MKTNQKLNPYNELEGKKEGNRITYNRKKIEYLLWQI